MRIAPLLCDVYPCSHWTEFHEIWYMSIIRKSVEKIQVSLKSDKNNGTLHEADRYTFLIISRSFLLRMKNVLNKSCRDNKNIHFGFSNFFTENRVVYEIMCKILYSGTGYRWQYSACALHAGYLRLQTHSHNM
jgi:hypothetical protein